MTDEVTSVIVKSDKCSGKCTYLKFCLYKCVIDEVYADNLLYNKSAKAGRKLASIVNINRNIII